MNQTNYLKIRIVFLLLLSTTIHIFAEDLKIPDVFSVNIVRKVQDREIVQRLYRSKEKMRSEINDGGMSIKTILDKETSKVIVIDDANKTYLIFPYNNKARNKGFLDIDLIFSPKKNIKFIGKEVISSLECNKYLITSEGEDSLYCWAESKTGIPVKFSNEQESQFAFWNGFSLNLGASNLFDIPIGYKLKESPNIK